MRCQKSNTVKKNCSREGMFFFSPYRFHLLIRFYLQVSVNFDGKNIFPIPFRLVFLLTFAPKSQKVQRQMHKCLNSLFFFLFVFKRTGVREIWWLRVRWCFFFCTCGMNVCERLIKVDKQKFRFIIGTTCRYFEQASQNQVEQNVKQSILNSKWFD